MKRKKKRPFKYDFHLDKSGGKGYDFSAQSLNPSKESYENFARVHRSACPNISCGEDRADFIINLGRGAKECRTCGTYYIVSETLSLPTHAKKKRRRESH